MDTTGGSVMKQLQQALWQLHPRRQVRHAQGGVLVIGSSMLLVIVLMGVLLWGISWRLQQRQRLQVALINGTRVAAQHWSYGGFASGGTALESDQILLQTAHQVLAANLANVPGLQGSPEKLAHEASWMIIRAGGTCGTTVIQSTGLCGSISVQVRSLPIGPQAEYTLTATTVTSIDTH